jgi:hypothetical protein
MSSQAFAQLVGIARTLLYTLLADVGPLERNQWYASLSYLRR